MYNEIPSIEPNTIAMGEDSKIQLTNTLTNSKERFQPIENGKIGMYACGVTVYDECHLGHAMQAILFDTFVQYLRYRGFEVTYVRNYTDVDDKIIDRAAQLGISPLELSEQMIEKSKTDMKSLGVNPADHEPKVSDNIPEILDYIQKLIDKGYAYSTESGEVYYRVSKKNDYGKLSNQKTKQLMVGHRIDSDTSKENPLDFALWKSDQTEGASWESPWGRGRPGWHIECSVMSTKFLGRNFDIHGGGRDLVFPHHENEIAQSEAHSDGTYANYWIHTGLMTLENQKMSKSVGNLIRIQDALEKYSPEVLRWTIFQVHYSSDLNFTHQGFSLSMRRLYYFYQTLKRCRSFMASGPVGDVNRSQTNTYEESFMKAMDDDFQIPRALVVINQMFQDINELVTKKGVKAPIKRAALEPILKLIQTFGQVLGLFQREPEEFLNEMHKKYLDSKHLESSSIEKLITKRNQYRSSKEFEEADKIRAELLEMGIQILDTPEGTQWELSETALEELVR